MKKFTSLLALFLVCFGITASAQTIETIGENITDPKTQLTDGTYVLLKNQAKGYLYVGTDYVLQSNVEAPAKGSGTEYIWKVSVREDGNVAFYAADGRLIGRPNFNSPAKALKTVNQMGAWNVIEKYGATANWQLHVQWTYKGKPHEYILATNGAGNLVAEEVSKPSANAEFQIIPVTVTKSADQIAIDEIVKSWTGLEKYAGGITEKDLKNIGACKTEKEAQDAVAAAVKNPIDATEYFQILNVKSGKALNVTDGALSEVDASIFDASQLWKLTKSAEGKYTFLQADHNKFVQAPGNNALGAAEVVLDVTSLDLAQWSLSAEGKYLSVNAEGQFVAAADAAAEGAQWYLLPKKDLRIMLNPVYGADGTTVVEGWASVYLPFNATCGNSAANIEYYGVSEVGNGVAKLQKTDGIQAGKGIILHHVGDQVDFGFKIGKNAKNTEDQAWNCLKGTNVAQETAGNGNVYYVLGLNNGEAGLFGSNSTVMKANRAYLEVLPEAAPVNGFRLEFGETTGIEGVVAPVEEANAVYYDLSGRRVLNPSNGIYIKNGKKVYVK